MKAKLLGALRSVTIWVNTLFLALYPFTAQIMSGLQEQMPTLSTYLPENIYKATGIAIVVFNLYQRTRTNKSLSEKGVATG